MDKKLRSGIKSAIWRVFGVAILASITYAYTREWITTGLVTVIHHGVFLFVFYFHERLWLKVRGIRNLTHRSLLKMFTYETVCGNLILGTITYCITGDWKQMTAITLTYIGVKHVCYVFNEFIWHRIRLGTYTTLLLLLTFGGSVSADYWAGNSIRAGNIGISTEVRMDTEVYLRLLQIDWRHQLSPSTTMTLSEREVRTETVEHSPMVSLTYRRGGFKNRVRLQYRIKEDESIMRLRNKVTYTLGLWHAVVEAFVEEGEWYRNRYYIGLQASSNLGLFFMRQVTDGDGIWVFGTSFGVEAW